VRLAESQSQRDGVLAAPQLYERRPSAHDFFADRATVPTNVLIRFLDQESVLLNLNTEKYFGLDSVGTRSGSW